MDFEFYLARVRESEARASDPRPQLWRYSSMKKAIVWLVAAMIASVASPNAFAIKEFSEAWAAVYAEKSTNEGFKKLAAEAKCNVCHIDGENKKKHNPYGDVLEHEGLTKKNFPPAKFRKTSKVHESRLRKSSRRSKTRKRKAPTRPLVSA